jgi:hypothetical protein
LTLDVKANKAKTPANLRTNMASLPLTKHVDKVLARFKVLVANIEDSSDFDEAWQDEALLLGARLVNYSALCYKQYQSAVLALRRIESDAYGNDSEVFEELDCLTDGGRISHSMSFFWLVTHNYVSCIEDTFGGKHVNSLLRGVQSKARRKEVHNRPWRQNKALVLWSTILLRKKLSRVSRLF